jgi:hypothetical protein
MLIVSFESARRSTRHRGAFVMPGTCTYERTCYLMIFHYICSGKTSTLLENVGNLLSHISIQNEGLWELCVGEEAVWWRQLDAARPLRIRLRLRLCLFFVKVMVF